MALPSGSDVQWNPVSARVLSRVESRAMENMSTRVVEVVVGTLLGAGAFLPWLKIGPALNHNPRHFRPATPAERVVMFVFGLVFLAWGAFGLGG